MLLLFAPAGISAPGAIAPSLIKDDVGLSNKMVGRAQLFARRYSKDSEIVDLGPRGLARPTAPRAKMPRNSGGASSLFLHDELETARLSENGESPPS